MTTPSNDTLAAAIAIAVITALVWLLKHFATRASEREKAEREAAAKAAADDRDDARRQRAEYTSVLKSFADSQLKGHEVMSANSAVLQGLTGAIERQTTTLTTGIHGIATNMQGIREDLDALMDRSDDDTPVARPRAMAGGLRRPQRGQKDE